MFLFLSRSLVHGCVTGISAWLVDLLLILDVKLVQSNVVEAHRSQLGAKVAPVVLVQSVDAKLGILQFGKSQQRLKGPKTVFRVASQQIAGTDQRGSRLLDVKLKKLLNLDAKVVAILHAWIQQRHPTFDFVRLFQHHGN